MRTAPSIWLPTPANLAFRRSMRVLVLTNMWPDSAGLFGTFVADQVDDLRAGGVETDVLSFDARRATFRYASTALRLRGRLRAERGPSIQR